MQDSESKVALLTYYAKAVTRVSCAIPDDYVARVYGRSLFLAVDSFLGIAPRLKNKMQAEGRISPAESAALTHRINKLKTDFTGYYETIRDKLAAHQQELGLGLLLRTWNEIDSAIMTILSDDIQDIWDLLENHGAVSTYARPPEPDKTDLTKQLAQIKPKVGVRMGVDRVALTRPNTVSIIPTGLFQEKAMRVLTAFQSFQILITSDLHRITANWPLASKACIDLFVTDACNIVDDLFDDRQARSQVAAEQSLTNAWRAASVQGIESLELFQRDAALEHKLRELRNTFSAHLDPEIPLAELLAKLNSFPLSELTSYLEAIWCAFRSVCEMDIRTRLFLIHGEELHGATGVATTNDVKPF